MYIGAILITQWNDNSEKTAKLNSASFIRELSQIQQTINWFSICVYTPHETFIHIIMKTSIERSVWTIIYHLFICWNRCVPVLTLFESYKSVSLVEKSKVYSHIHASHIHRKRLRVLLFCCVLFTIDMLAECVWMCCTRMYVT